MLSGDAIELLRSLNHTDKLYAIQLLISDLVKEEAELLKSGFSSLYDDSGDAELGELEEIDEERF
ncbi:hypothetical protein [Chamaesiphon minutus]|uniref:Uncharacterized protein n=1 Tax=Chamaesiphon minutus (strain ATCC 27169 / PCC 6605) TaxID=1173020 RepID=K9UNW8_CHAP6|nr:hypothetical protein [Chamaesiphon minutus]AFY96520.1 hypothetical protein Cha6605_5656 [Chamaesiphon minutus PCC 6605]